MNKIFVVDDQKAVCYSLKRLLESEGFDVQTATSGKAALKMLKDSKPDVMLIDVKMPEMDGFEVLKKVKEADSKIQVVMMTAFSTTEMAIQAMKSGAYDYTIKPLDNNDLIGRLKGALKTKALMEDVVTVEESEDYIPGERIIGKSLKMLEVFKQIGKIAPVATTVLITGESGTGKELVARAIYHHSNRANKPFLAINCAAIPEHLIESELFGYERGAFTGADSRRIGKFEQCDGGTIFLDEIGDMPLFTQAKLLRSLQGGNFQRLGGIETVRSDVRIIAATNKNLEEMVQKGLFRQDVYFRISVATIEIPPLRERKEDISDLVNYFIQKHGRTHGSNIRGLTTKTLKRLQEYTWPGNVRELENTVQRLMVFCQNDFLSIDSTDECIENVFRQSMCSLDVDAAIENLINSAFQNESQVAYQNLISKIEIRLIQKALELSNENQVRAAQLLGISRNTLRKKMN